MKRLIIMLVVSVLATLTLATAASASTSSVPTRHVVVGEPCVKGGQIATCWMTRRKHFQFTIGPSEWIARARWSHWNGHSARGRGTLWVSDVGTQRLGRVTVVLSRPRGHQLISGHRHPHFTRMHLTGPGARDTARRWRWEGRFHEWQEAATAASLRSVPVVDASGHGWAHPSVRPPSSSARKAHLYSALLAVCTVACAGITGTIVRTLPASCGPTAASGVAPRATLERPAIGSVTSAAWWLAACPSGSGCGLAGSAAGW
jgi:hypothetical protein